MIDGYFLDVLQSDKMPKDENEIILERVRLLLLRLGHSKHSNRNEYIRPLSIPPRRSNYLGVTIVIRIGRHVNFCSAVVFCSVI